MFRSNLSDRISIDIPPKITFLVGVTSDSQLSLAKKRINGYRQSLARETFKWLLTDNCLKPKIVEMAITVNRHLQKSVKFVIYNQN